LKRSKDEETRRKLVNELGGVIESDLKESLPKELEPDIRKEYKKQIQTEAERLSLF